MCTESHPSQPRRLRPTVHPVACPPHRVARGFTVTEMVVVIIIVAVLAAVFGPSVTGFGVVQERADYDKIIYALTYARKSAVAKRRYVCVALPGSSVTLTVDSNPPESTATPFGSTCPFVTPLALPTPDTACAGSSTNQTCLKKVTFTSTASSIQFDPLGRASAAASITVAGFTPIQVESDTGLIH